MKKLILSLFLATLLLSGCKTKEVIKYVNTESVRDSLVYLTVKDTLIKYLPQKNEVFGVKKSHLKTDLAFSYAAVDSCGLLYHSIENYGMILSKMYYKTVWIKYYIKNTTTITKQLPPKIKTEYIDDWIRSFGKFSLVVCIALFFYICIRVYKRLTTIP